MSDYVVTVPKITAITITPNPVGINTGFTISAAASDVELILTPQLRYSGTFYAGEE